MSQFGKLLEVNEYIGWEDTAISSFPNNNLSPSQSSFEPQNLQEIEGAFSKAIRSQPFPQLVRYEFGASQKGFELFAAKQLHNVVNHFTTTSQSTQTKSSLSHLAGVSLAKLY